MGIGFWGYLMFAAMLIPWLVAGLFVFLVVMAVRERVGRRKPSKKSDG